MAFHESSVVASQNLALEFTLINATQCRQNSSEKEETEERRGVELTLALAYFGENKAAFSVVSVGSMPREEGARVNTVQ